MTPSRDRLPAAQTRVWCAFFVMCICQKNVQASTELISSKTYDYDGLDNFYPFLNCSWILILIKPETLKWIESAFLVKSLIKEILFIVLFIVLLKCLCCRSFACIIYKGGVSNGRIFSWYQSRSWKIVSFRMWTGNACLDTLLNSNPHWTH